MRPTNQPTGRERHFDPDEIIVSKTDLKGRITYANQTFIEISEYSERELLGQPHNMIRHPEMPQAVFKLLWDAVGEGKEIFAYVVNQCKSGDHYWVLAHVTPTLDESGAVTGFHSNRRVPAPGAVETIRPIYAEMLRVEKQHEDWRAGMDAATELLHTKLREMGTTYEELVFSLTKAA